MRISDWSSDWFSSVLTDSEDIFDAAFGGAAGDAALAWANAGQDHVEIDHTTIYRSPVSGARNIWTGNTISGNVLGMMVGGEVNANEIGGASAALANTNTGNSTEIGRESVRDRWWKYG